MDEDVDGSIVTVRCRNFFCHENLEINFNKNVNFIVGRNGSGKSAVLTALVVGLGARASTTNRGTSLQSFVKMGANSATVEIKLKNSSAKAYKPEVYGKYITIVRHITASGGSSYKVKSASGEVVSTKHEEVQAITLAHDIQVDNPICVLNQDEARSFHASNAKKKYAMYRKATNLEQTENNYKIALENCDKAKNIWKRKKDVFIDLEKELKKLEECHSQLQSREESEEYRLKLQNEFYWSEIAGMEEEAKSMQKQYDTHNNRIKMLQEKLQAMERSYGDNNEILEALRNTLGENTTERNYLEQKLNALSKTVRESNKEWQSVRNRLTRQQELVRREQRKVADLEQEINNISSGEACSRRAAIEKEANSAEQAMREVEARCDTAQLDAAQAQANHQRRAAAADDAAAALQRHQYRHRNLEMQLRELDSRGTDSLAVYGNKMVELKRRVEEASKRRLFSETPRGPVGSYLKVKDKKWASSLEHIIGGNIRTFCVNTAEDSRKLFSIMNQVFGSEAKPAVTASKFLPRQHDVSGRCVRAAGYQSALDSLVVSDPVVANYLIDNLSVENTLLVPEHEAALRLSDDVENVPQNCSKIVTLDGTEYYPAPSYRCYGGAGAPARYLQVNTHERRRQIEQEMGAAARDVSAAERAHAAAAREVEAAAEAAAEAVRARHALARRRNDTEAALRRARDALQMLQAPQHQVLEEELLLSKEKVMKLGEEIEKLSESDNTQKANVEEIENEIKKINKRKIEVTSEVTKINEEIEKEQMKNDRTASERTTYAQRVREDTVRLAAFKESLDQKWTSVEEKTVVVLQLGPRIDNPRDNATVLQELKKLESKLKCLRTVGLSKQEVVSKLLDVKRTYRHTKGMLEKLEHVIEQLKDASERHLHNCRKVQIEIAKTVQYSFQSILALRGYAGRMEIDKTKGLLEMCCSGREAVGKRVAASTSSLSGGERSYSTVAFIMALWECVELPFHFMDEFDVFMDNVNRKIVMELLIDHALKNSNRQFVFLTPQDASSVTAGPNIKIHRMADPRRN